MTISLSTSNATISHHKTFPSTPCGALRCPAKRRPPLRDPHDQASRDDMNSWCSVTYGHQNEDVIWWWSNGDFIWWSTSDLVYLQIYSYVKVLPFGIKPYRNRFVREKPIKALSVTWSGCHGSFGISCCSFHPTGIAAFVLENGQIWSYLGLQYVKSKALEEMIRNVFLRFMFAFWSLWIHCLLTSLFVSFIIPPISWFYVSQHSYIDHNLNPIGGWIIQLFTQNDHRQKQGHSHTRFMPETLNLPKVLFTELKFDKVNSSVT